MPFHNLAVELWTMTPAFLRRAYYWASGKLSVASIFLPDKSDVVEIKSGIGKNVKMYLNLRRERGYYFGVHESDVQSILCKTVLPGMKAYNIGAHLGFFTLILRKLVGPEGRVIAFEPNPRAREILIKNLSLNGIDSEICVEDYALADFDGGTNFSLSLSDTQGRFEDLPHVKPGSVIQVPCKRLDTYAEETKVIPDFILMDVEHAEGRVLRGMARLLDRHKPIIVVELHGEAAIKESWQEFQKHDYRVAKIPGMEIVQSVNDLTYGHYLGAHSSYFREHQIV